MRIISGKFRGKSINFLKNKITRPLKDSVKENIFNILMHSKAINIKLEKSNILDLYSGVGSFGLECLSRNAQFVTFVEKNLDALNVLKENVIKLSVKNQTEIIGYKIENTNKWHKKINIMFFFLDPPFINNEYLKILEIIKSKRNFQ
jgi:N6-adenine-specific methylase